MLTDINITAQCETEPDKFKIELYYEDGDQYVSLTSVNYDKETTRITTHIDINRFKKIIDGVALVIESKKEPNK